MLSKVFQAEILLIICSGQDLQLIKLVFNML